MATSMVRSLDHAPLESIDTMVRDFCEEKLADKSLLLDFPDLKKKEEVEEK